MLRSLPRTLQRTHPRQTAKHAQSFCRCDHKVWNSLSLRSRRRRGRWEIGKKKGRGRRGSSRSSLSLLLSFPIPRFPQPPYAPAPATQAKGIDASISSTGLNVAKFPHFDICYDLKTIIDADKVT